MRVVVVVVVVVGGGGCNSSFAETLVCVFRGQGHRGIARRRQKARYPIHSCSRKEKIGEAEWQQLWW